MPGKNALAIVALWSGLASAEPTRLLFTGDVLLAREVQREITARRGRSPWEHLKTFFQGADWIQGNFEGAVGDPRHCPEKDKALCFAVPAENLGYLKKAGFTAMGLENNHAADLGDPGRSNTRAQLLAHQIQALDFEHSPGFFRHAQHVVAFVVVNHIAGKDGVRTEVPSLALRQKIRLAKTLASWVFVSIHWGTELTDWPQPAQTEMARWLIKQGADVILGHHPHVVQAPECIEGKPVFYSLGNHVFDQKYPQTKAGLIADCRIEKDRLSCTGVPTRTPVNSAFPVLSETPPVKLPCMVAAPAPFTVAGHQIRPRLAQREYRDGEMVLEGEKDGRRWSAVGRQLVSLTKGRLDSGPSAEEFLVTVEKHPSPIDKETGPRPYVYALAPHGLVAKWRGSALAWPLLDATLIPTELERPYLCALHRKDSFLELNPQSTGTRTALYQWNGFGFTGVDDPKLNSICAATF